MPFTSVQSFRSALLGADVPPPAAPGDLAAWLGVWRGRARLDRVLHAVFVGPGGEVQAPAGMQVHEVDPHRPLRDLTTHPALTGQDLVDHLWQGWEAVDPAADLLVLGGAGHSAIPAAAIAYALYGGAATDWADASDAGVVAAALGRHRSLADGATPLEILRDLGAREIVALAGAIGRARVDQVPVLLDGQSALAAAAVLHAMSASALDHAVAAQPSPVVSRLGRPVPAEGVVAALDALRAALAT